MKYFTAILLCLSIQSFASGSNHFSSVDSLIEQSFDESMEGEECSSNWQCWEPIEHCLDGACVPRDAFNQCYTDFDCWPGSCEDGICQY